jgi:hypothetical protein
MVTDKNGQGQFGGPGSGGEGTLQLAPPADILPEPVPIWFAALLAIPCQATAGASGHAVRWHHVRGRAVYTNAGQVTELIQPFGVSLERGQTVTVSWTPGDTTYTVEVCRPFEPGA